VSALSSEKGVVVGGLWESQDKKDGVCVRSAVGSPFIYSQNRTPDETRPPLTGGSKGRRIRSYLGVRYFGTGRSHGGTRACELRTRSGSLAPRRVVRLPGAQRGRDRPGRRVPSSVVVKVVAKVVVVVRPRVRCHQASPTTVPRGVSPIFFFRRDPHLAKPPRARAALSWLIPGWWCSLPFKRRGAFHAEALGGPPSASSGSVPSRRSMPKDDGGALGAVLYRCLRDQMLPKSSPMPSPVRPRHGPAETRCCCSFHLVQSRMPLQPPACVKCSHGPTKRSITGLLPVSPCISTC